MPVTREEILQAALQLPQEDRWVIANGLLETLPEDMPGIFMDDPDLMGVLESRSGDLEGSVPWEQLRDEFRKTP